MYDDTIDRFGGIGLYVTTLGGALSRRGHHVEYLVGSSQQQWIDDSRVRALARNVPVRFNGNVLSMPAWSRARTLRGALVEGRFDVLHVQVPYSPLMAGRLLRACDARCAVVGTYHVASSRVAARVGAKLLRAPCRSTDARFDRMLAVSQTASDFASECSGLSVDEVIPNLLDAGRVRSQANLRCDLPSAEVVFVGRLVPRKGAEHLLRALHALAGFSDAQRPRAAILGDGPLRVELQQLAERLGLTDRVGFHGAVSDPEKAAMLRQAHIACFPSLFGESFGVVVLEALAAGADMVLAGDNPGYRELLQDPAVLVQPRDSRMFARRLATLLGDADLRRSLGARQRELLRSCSHDEVTERVERAYVTALESRRGCAYPRNRRVEAPLVLP